MAVGRGKRIEKGKLDGSGRKTREEGWKGLRWMGSVIVGDYSVVEQRENHRVERD